jgi:ribulose-5-phosphate 4-epimerase/fuculose-1-phosphate aldolase
MDALSRAKRDLVIANRILAREDVVDAYGHISTRHPEDPTLFLLSRSRSPELVEDADIMTFRMDGSPSDGDTRPAYLERFIHAAIYLARPEVKAVVHAHSESTLPFGITATKLRAVIHSGSIIGHDIPLWDIDEKFGDSTDLLVRNIEQGKDLAARLGANKAVLMRGHGFSAASNSLKMLVRIAVYLPRNARAQLEAMRLGEIKPMSAGEISMRDRQMADPEAPELMRAWDYWAARAGVSDLL